MLQRALQSPWLAGRRFQGGEGARVEVHGATTTDFAPLVELLRGMVARHGGGASLSVFHRGERVADLWAGTRDAAGRPWLRDTLAPSFSTTKGVAATALHIMVDRGLIRYDDPVCRYWPEFAQAGKSEITVRQVLSHQSGLYHIRQIIDRADQMLDWDYVIRALERARPVHRPGERTGYHGLTFGFLVGELVRRVSGRPFSEMVQREIAEPLGLDGLYVGAPEAALERVARLVRGRSLWWSLETPRLRSRTADRWAIQSFVAFVRLAQRGLDLGRIPIDVESMLDAFAPRGIANFDFADAATVRATIPAANGVFTARSLARMYAALAAGGELDGTRLLSLRTLREATKKQSRTGRFHVIPFDMGWRLGYHGVITPRGVLPHAFGHFGIGGSGAWACPESQLALALIVNSGIGSPFGDLRIIRASGAAVACARGRPLWEAGEGDLDDGDPAIWNRADSLH